MQLLCPSDGPEASLDRDGDADESRPQSSLLPATDGHVRQQQQNFWLRRTILMAFSFLFIACALALIGVSRHMTAQNGLSLSLSSSSYSWTYGPTGVLVIILALWRQVDYNCRSMQPWWEMVQGPSTAARSVLLDYISPFQPIVCANALKNGHNAVFISTLSFLVLKLIILLSTTLFVVEPTWRLEPVSFRYLDAFSSESMWNPPVENFTGEWGGIRDYSEQGEVTVWSYVAMLNYASSARSQGDKTLRVEAYQSLIPPHSSANISSISTAVDVFVPSVTCEEASLSFSATTLGENATDLYYTFDSPSCLFRDVYFKSIHCENLDLCKNTTERYHSVYQVDCAAHRNLNDAPSPESSAPDTRYAISMADLSITFTDRRYKHASIQRSSATICKVGYGMVSANVTWDAFSGETTLDERPVLGDSPRHLINMTNHDLAEKILANINAASNTLLVDLDINGANSSFSTHARPFFQLLALQRKLLAENQNALLQPSYLGELSAAIIEGLSTEFAKKALLVRDPGGEPSEGIAHVSENRLHLRRYTLWPMVSGFFLLSVFCGILSLIIPSKGNQRHVSGSIASYASVLMKSPSFLNVLKRTGHYRNNQLNQRLENMHFTISPCRHELRLEAFGSTRQASSPKGYGKKRPWLPLAARLPIVGLTFVLPLLTITLLEILQRLSDERHGLLDLDSSSSATVSYAIRLVSSLLAFLIATLFNNLDFSIAVFSPFSLLRSGSVPAQGSVLFHLLGVSPFLILVKTLRLRQYGSAASNLSTLLGSLFTIFVSGLWVISDSIGVVSVSTAKVVNWDTSWLDNNLNDNGASFELNIIRHGGANTTSSIRGDIVLPILGTDTTVSFDGANNTYNTTVLRPILHCDSVPQEDIFVTTTITRLLGPNESNMEAANVSITLLQAVSPDCSPHATGHDDIRNVVVASELVRGGDDPSEAPERNSYGELVDLDTIPGRSEVACPSTAILFGTFGWANGTGSQKGNNLSALLCSQKIEEIPATITYRGYPSNKNLNDIRLNFENSKYWANGTSNSTNITFRWKEFLDSGLTTFYPGPEDGFYDKFFNHILFGPQGIPPADILGPNNIGALTEAVTHAFKEYFAHIIDLNLRSKDTATSIQGTSVQNTTRLAVHRVSKIILQSLLAATTILSFVGYKLVKIRGTLPRNPCSIASTMGFLADSQLCDPKTGILPKDASLMNERELRQSLHGFVFSLGWWERSRDSNASGSASPSGEDSSDLDAGVQQEASENTYFGIDVGHTNALGFSKKQH